MTPRRERGETERYVGDGMRGSCFEKVHGRRRRKRVGSKVYVAEASVCGSVASAADAREEIFILFFDAFAAAINSEAKNRRNKHY